MIFTVNSIQDISLDLIQKTIRDLRDEEQQMETAERNKLLDFYDGLQDKPDYLEDWGFKDIELPLQTVNLTKKIIDKISLVYKYAPDRKFEGEGEKSSFSEFEMQNPKFNIWQKETERKKNLLSIVLKRPIYTINGWRFWTDTQFKPWFLEGDPFTPVAYSIPIKHEVTNTSKGAVKKDYWMYWSDTHYFWYLEDEPDKMFVPNIDKQFVNEKFEHKLGIMPIVESRTNYPTETYWTSGAVDLMQSNQSINVNMSNLNVAIHYQAFDQVVVNGVEQEQVNKIKIGANKSIGLSNSDMDMKLLNFNPKITEMIEAIKFEMLAISKNYNVSMDWEMSGDPSSGFALLVKNIDLMESREDDVELAEMEEQQVVKVIQRQQEVYKLKPRFPKDKKLIVDFHEINFPINQAEELDRWEWEFKHNISTPLDYIQSKEGLTEEEARKRWDDNKSKNATLSPVEKAFNDTLNQINNEPTIDTQQ